MSKLTSYGRRKARSIMKDEPKVCYFCHRMDRGPYNSNMWHIHHIDLDEGNNDRENLAWAHALCNKAFHGKGEHSAERRRKQCEGIARHQSLRKRGILPPRKRPPPHSDETKRKISESHRRHSTIDLKKLRELTERGLTTGEIKKHSAFKKLHICTIRRWQKRLGIWIDGRRLRKQKD